MYLITLTVASCVSYSVIVTVKNPSLHPIVHKIVEKPTIYTQETHIIITGNLLRFKFNSGLIIRYIC